MIWDVVDELFYRKFKKPFPFNQEPQATAEFPGPRCRGRDSPTGHDEWLHSCIGPHESLLQSQVTQIAFLRTIRQQ